MELNYNKKINIIAANNNQKILPVPINKEPVPSVEKPNYYGRSPYPMPYQVSSRKNDESQYCNTLEPSPRNVLLNVPNESNNCNKKKIQPFNRDSCYLMDNKRQGVLGIVCNQSGGSDNSNHVRGRDFGLDYDWNLFNEKKKLEYTVEQPVQNKMFLENKTLVNDKTNFYPTTNYYLSKGKNYNTYPKMNNYMTEGGLPTYVNPYQTLNNIENFMNYDKNKNMMNFIILLMTIIVLLVIIYLTRR